MNNENIKNISYLYFFESMKFNFIFMLIIYTNFPL